MNEQIKNIEEFISWTKQLEGRVLLFRGLADATWEVSASAYRRIKTFPDEVPSPSVFQNYVKQLLNYASLRGFREQQGNRFSDLELLAELQHNGAATCMIDFTTNSLIALWFACQEEPDKDKPGKEGKVVAMPTDKIELFSTVSYQQIEKPIEDFLHENDKLWKWSPEHMSNRIVAQQSVFVFGRGKIEQIHYKEVMIDRNSKEEIRTELRERFGITEQHLFSDFTGFALSNAYNRPYYDYAYKNYFDQGTEFYQRGDATKAIDAYSQAIRLNPEFASAYYNRGQAKFNSLAFGPFPRAFRESNINWEHHAKSPLPTIQEAMYDFGKAIELDPKYIDAYFHRGVAKDQLKDYQGAISDYDKVIELDPQHIAAYHNRGIAKQESGDEAGAKEDSAKADELIEIQNRQLPEP